VQGVKLEKASTFKLEVIFFNLIAKTIFLLTPSKKTKDVAEKQTKSNKQTSKTGLAQASFSISLQELQIFYIKEKKYKSLTIMPFLSECKSTQD